MRTNFNEQSNIIFSNDKQLTSATTPDVKPEQIDIEATSAAQDDAQQQVSQNSIGKEIVQSKKFFAKGSSFGGSNATMLQAQVMSKEVDGIDKSSNETRQKRKLHRKVCTDVSKRRRKNIMNIGVAAIATAMLMSAAAGALRFNNANGGFGISQLPPENGTEITRVLTADVAQFVNLDAARNANQIINNWNASDHVYTIGDLKFGSIDITDAQVQEVERWLAQNAPNWSVICYDDMNSFGDLREKLGTGIANNSEFAQFVHEQTGEKNGAIILIVFGQENRKVYYFGSEAYDNHQLGEDAWQGNLDQPFINAMKDGGRFVDAIKDTVTSIDSQLDSTIASEISNIESSIESAQSNYQVLEQQHASFKNTYVHASGEMANPPLSEIADYIDRAETAKRDGNYNLATSLISQAQSSISNYLMAYEQFANTPETLTNLSSQLDQAQSRQRADKASELFVTARNAIADTEELLERGDLSYVSSLQKAEQAVSQTIHTIDRADNAAIAGRTTMYIGGFAAMLGLAALGFITNRRRRGIKDEALEKLNAVEAAIETKTSELHRLLGEADQWLGDTPSETEQLYKGKTYELAREIIADICDLFTMAGSAGRVANEAKSLIKPTNIFKQISNLFSKGNYKEGLALLKDKPIEFDPESGLELAIEGKSENNWLQDLTEKLTADIDQFKPFKMTFEDLINKFNEEAASTAKNLGRVRDAVTGSKDLLDSLDKKKDVISKDVLELGQAGAADGLYILPNITKSVIPAAIEQIKQARKNQRFDPISAVEISGAKADVMLGDAAMLTNICKSTRNELIPQLEKNKASLQASDLKTVWIDDQLSDLSKKATRISKDIVAAPMENAIDKLAQELQSFGITAQLAVKLDKKRREISPKDIAETEKIITNARKQISNTLNVPESKTLAEKGLNPDTNVESAKELLTRSKSLISEGAIAEAEEKLTKLDEELTTSKSLVEKSLTSLQQHANRVKDISENNGQLTALSKERSDLFKSMSISYASSVIASVKSNTEHADALLSKASNQVQKAEGLYSHAELINASDELDLATAKLVKAKATLDEISELNTKLIAFDKKNESTVLELDRLANKVDREIGDSRVRNNTRSDAHRAIREFRNASQLVSGNGRDPEKVATQLRLARNKLDSAIKGIRHDIRTHDEAESSISSAAMMVRRARNYHGYGGTTVSGPYGSHLLMMARSAMAAQNYEDADSYADQAYSQASSALSHAEAEARRKKRRDEEAQQQHNNNNSYGGGSHSGGSGGFSGGSSFGGSSGGFSGGSSF